MMFHADTEAVSIFGLQPKSIPPSDIVMNFNLDDW